MSLKCALALLAVVATFTTVHTADITESMKCLPNDKQIEVALNCITSVTGISEPEAMTKVWDNEETKEKIEECIFSAMEIVKDEVFQTDKFEMMITEMNATDEVKNQLMTIMETCVEKYDKSKSKEIIECMEEDTLAVCSVKTKSESEESKM
ncbi:hypothetical protein CHUAL_005480 [Chamberlinius hualienensis]